ncbi:MAG: dihydrofolate reductase [Caldilineaceae bacterium]|nr:dihydrofolate reductase [Caldilineaceae bacterium]MCB9157403.1 dihydrofolate reductase [Caldilineaceae bacterium]
MRNLVAFMHMSLDGFAGGPNGELDWIAYDEELEKYAETVVNTVGAALYGRVTYHMMEFFRTVPDNPDSSEHERAHAAWIEEIPKVVVSTTLASSDWHNTSIIHDDLITAINALKEQPGKDIVIFGSPSLTQALAQLNLVDEYQLTVSPVLLGQGIQFFAPLAKKQSLQLLSSKVFASGALGLHYQVVKS